MHSEKHQKERLQLIVSDIHLLNGKQFYYRYNVGIRFIEFRTFLKYLSYIYLVRFFLHVLFVITLGRVK